MNVTTHSPAINGSAAALTISQRRIWTGQMLDPNKPLYNMAMAFHIEGAIEASTFSYAFQRVIDEHDALRTVFLEDNGEPQQQVLDELRFDTKLIDISDRPSPDETAERLLKERARTHFVLAERLFDSALFLLDSERCIWFINQHHLICDAWSNHVLHHRLSEYYQLALEGRLGEAAPPPQFRDYRIAENTGRKDALGHQAAHYWTDKFSRQRPALELYGRRTDPASTATSRITRDIGQARSEKLRELAGAPPLKSISQDLSLFYLFAALLFAYIHRVSGQEDLVIGSPSHNRSKISDKQTLGLFIELFPLQLAIKPGDTFRTLMESVIPEANQLLRHAMPGASSGVPGNCYAVVLNYLNVKFGDFCGMPSQASWIHPGHGDRGHALRLQVHDFEGSGSFTLLFDVRQDTFPPSIRENAAEHFLKLMDALLEDLDTPIEQISLLSDRETELLVRNYNDTASVPPPVSTIIDLIKEQVDKASDAAAVAEKERELSYAQLDEISEQMALNLKRLGIGHEDFVAVYMDRSASLIVSLLAILKAGAAFVPIDSAFPEQRLAYVLEDSGCTLVLTSGDLKSVLPETTARIIEYDELIVKSSAEQSTTTGLEAIDNRSLAYMIYTSGSTGRPKGVMIEHRSLLNYLAWARKEYMADGPHDLPLFSSVAADLTITSLFLPLISGSTVIVYPEGEDGLDLSILDVFRDDRVDIIKLTPSHLALLDGTETPPARVKKLIVGGEDFKAGLARRLSSLYGGNITIYNEYGPTEATIGCMIFRFDPESDTQASVAIGGPIDNLRIYLLDKNLNPVPVGVKGEIYIGGAGLARGYHKQDEMSAEKFVEDPFLPGQKMYFSGDIGRWRSAGVLDYLGRDDDQVKVRGFRIERGEIEAALCGIDGISESFCQVVEHNRSSPEVPLARCRSCGLPANVPKADLDENEVCAPCRNFERQRHLAEQYFKSVDQLHLILKQAKQASRGRYDCLMQYSGGKDSTFALYKLVEMGMHPLVFSFDNGFIPESVKDNVRRIVDDLKLDLHWGRTAAMNDIFVDSLRRFSNVCNGCQKVINTMSVSLACEHDIEYIFTGLSRGQSFETRVADLLNIGMEDINEIDEAILEARKAYHQMDDAVNKLLDVTAFNDDSIFERVQFIDFYRYYDVPLSEVLDFLNNKTPWTRPPDTGRSTNCLINEAGIYIHKKERGYHNYAAPYSWDVRLGHKQRASALKELEDDIDEARVNRMLKEIGYDPDEKTSSSVDQRIVAYYVGEKDFTPEELRTSLARTLPGYMIPAHFLRMQSFPLNPIGKIDHRSLPLPGDMEQARMSEYIAPRSTAEELLTEIWERVLGVEGIGIYDNFFDLGGDSILNIQIVSRAVKAGIHITPALLFENQTVAELAAAASHVSSESAESDFYDGPLRLTPIQHWFFNLNLKNPNYWNMSVRLELKEKVVPEVLERAFQLLIDNHPSLRMRYKQAATGWEPSLIGKDETFRLDKHTLAEKPQPSAEKLIDQIVQSGHESIDIQNGPLLKALLFENSLEDSSILFIIIHHLAVDGISWYVLLDELQTAYQSFREGTSPDLLPEITSFGQFSQKLSNYANSPQAEKESFYWKSLGSLTGMQIPRDTDHAGNGLESSTERVVIKLERNQTHTLLHQLPGNKHASVEEILLSCLVKALYDWSGNSFIRIDKEGHGREDIIEGANLLRTTGWFTSLFPINFIVPAEKEIHRFLPAIKQQVRSIPNRGFSFGPLIYLNTNPQIIEDGVSVPKSEVLFNHLGELRQWMDHPVLFNTAAPLELHKSPGEKRLYLLEIASFILNGQLEVHWTYSRDVHKSNTIETLANEFLDDLIELIEKTKRKTAPPPSYPDQPTRSDGESSINKPIVSDAYPLTPLQSGILFHTLKEPGSGVYIEQYCCTIEGDFNPALFQQAWKEVINHHQILRTSFIWEQIDEPQQVINDAVLLDWHHEDLRGKSNEEIFTKLNEFLHKDREKGFPLTHAPLMRCALFYLDKEKYRWIWSFHHILCDGWSTSRIINELFKCYYALSKDLPISLLPRRPFHDYVFWLRKQDQFAAEKFWKAYLQGLDSPTPLSIRSFDANRNGYDKQELNFSEELTHSLMEVSKAKRLTLNTVILGAWAILLSRYSGDNEIIFGTTVSGRPHELEDVDNMIGLFINTLPLRIKIEPEKLFAQWLADILVNQVQARDYEYSSLVKIHEWSHFPPGVPLFESILVFENYPAQPQADNLSIEFDIKDIDYLEQSNYPLSIIVLPGEQLKLISVYDKQLFPDNSVVRLLSHLQTILMGFVQKPEQSICDLSLIPIIELNLITKWQHSSHKVSEALPVQRMFETVVDANREKPALVYLSESLSYQELNNRANRLAHFLLEKNLSPKSFHGIYIDRSAEMIIAILAVLKSGSAYIPLDPEYPVARIGHMISDSQPATILTLGRLANSLPDSDAVVISIDSEDINSNNYQCSNPDLPPTPESSAYVIYTSGSTGVPKGVLVTNQNLSSSTTARIEYYEERPERFLLLSSISFDSSVAGIFGTLCQGGCLYIPDRENYRDVSYLANVIHKNAITHILVIPSLYEYLLDYHSAIIDSLDTVIVAGESCSNDIVKKHQSALPHTRLFNEYGPTEATVWSTVFNCSGTDHYNSIPIGKPIGDVSIYILDQKLRRLPMGIPGELYLGGESISPGYLNNPDLTSKKFIQLSLPGSEQQRVYKTGDLVRLLDDGSLEYLGRNDEQVKLRGYRIEVGEIESVLTSIDNILRAAVIAKYPDVKSQQRSILPIEEKSLSAEGLIAFIVFKDDEEREINTIRTVLETMLPDFMIPNQFIAIDSLPLMPNGKIDRKRLLDPKYFKTKDQKTVLEPRTELETEIGSAWCEVLDLEQINMNDNFFEVGGHSLLAVTLFTRIKEKTGLDLPLALLFRYPRLKDLVEFLEEKKEKDDSTLAVSKGYQMGRSRSESKDLWDIMVPIKAEGALPPLFFLHAIGGNVLNYSALLPFMDEQLPVYGLQARGLDGVSEPYRNLEEMVAEYVRSIKLIQPHGPYLLAGASMGGALALEVAQVLKKENEEILFLGMFDTLGPEYHFQTESPEVDSRSAYLPHPGLLSRVTTKWPNNRASSILSHIINLTAYHLFKIIRKPRPEDLRQWLMVYCNFNCLHTYETRPYSGKITLFRSSYSNIEDRFYGWQDIAKGGVQIINIPAHHGSFVESPELGKELNLHLMNIVKND